MDRAKPFAFLCSLLLVFCLGMLVADAPDAQAAPSQTETIQTCSKSISSSASVLAAVAGKQLVVKSALLNSSGAGVVVFTDGDGGTTIANVYLEANKPFLVPSDLLNRGQGLRTTAGNGLYAVLSGATLTGVFSVAQE